MFPKYIVKNRFTYERIPDRDYSYRPDVWPWSYTENATLSFNVIPNLFWREKVGKIGDYAVCAAKPCQIALTKEIASRFPAVSGICVTADGAEGQKCRVTFFSEDKKSYACCFEPAKAKDGICFSTLTMDFEPATLLIETDAACLNLTVDLVCVRSTLAEWGGQAHFYTAENADLRDDGSALVLTSRGNGKLHADNLPLTAGSPYSMKMPLRNTVFAVLENQTDRDEVSLSFTSQSMPNPDAANAVLAVVPRDGAKHAVYFNLSDCPGCDGRLTSFALEARGKGELILHSYSFEQEKPFFVPYADVDFCLGDPNAETVKIGAHLTRRAELLAAGYDCLTVYAGTPADDLRMGLRYESTSCKQKLASVPLAGEEVLLENIPLRLGKTTLLPYQFLLFAEKKTGEALCLCDRFAIENYEDFDPNPYAFDLPDYTVSVLDTGAYGDAMHNDTNAIQAAIDKVAAAGGGRVLVPGSDDFYGKRYLVTCLVMRSNVDLHFEEGAIFWQAQRRGDYPYEAAYGHDAVMGNIEWTHHLHVSNLPMIHGANIDHFKVTGYGKLRMMDTGSEENVDMPGYSVGCPYRIHFIPLGCHCIHDAEFRDFSIIRSNNYHTDAGFSERVCYANVTLNEVKCVSGDGFNLSRSKNAFVNRCTYQSNDDGIILSTHYFDPRGILWWTNSRDEDQSVRHVKVVHSYLNSGGGRALALITWGTNDPIQEREEIADVHIHDNILSGVTSVGFWADNPYNGKQPFDNTETDDYSPVNGLDVTGNLYTGLCTLGPIHATNIRSDCGISSWPDFRNGDFSLGGMANWTTYPNANPQSVKTVCYADKEKGCICEFHEGDVRAEQVLCPGVGHRTFTAELMTGEEGALMYAETFDGNRLAEKAFVCRVPTHVSLSFDTPVSDVRVGFASVGRSAEGFAIFDDCRLDGDDRDEQDKQKLPAFISQVKSEFCFGDGFLPAVVNGMPSFYCDASKGEDAMISVGEYGAFDIEGAYQFGSKINKDNRRDGYGYRFSQKDGFWRELYFNEAQRTLILTEGGADNRVELYRRENFFFTSGDFHIFKLIASEKEVALWIDGGLSVLIPCPVRVGKVSLILRDTDLRICRPHIEKI